MNNILKELGMEYSPELPQVLMKYKFDAHKSNKPSITSPQDAYDYLMSIWNLDTLHFREEFCVLLLNHKKDCIGWSRISIGGSSATIVDPAKVFQVALLTNANSIILAHNHPSGNDNASNADIHLTKRLTDIGKILGIPVDDHIILTGDGYISLRDKGQM